MALLRFVEIDGRRYLWRDLVALRRAQARRLLYGIPVMPWREIVIGARGVPEAA